MGTHSGDASFLVVAHAPIHCSYDEDVFRLGLTVQQGGGGEFTCRREGCGREGLNGPGSDGGKSKEERREKGENRVRESMKERCWGDQVGGQCAGMCAYMLGLARWCSQREGRTLTPWELESQNWAT